MPVPKRWSTKEKKLPPNENSYLFSIHLTFNIRKFLQILKELDNKKWYL